MLGEISYRRISGSDVAQVVEVHRRCFSPAHVQRTIFGAHGVTEYLRSLVGPAGFISTHWLFGAWAGKALVGYIHGRHIGQLWHLNYVAVAPEFQRAGAGRTLWAKWIERRPQDAGKFSLDVEQNDALALDWYRRRGFTPVQTSWIYRQEPGIETAPSSAVIDPQSDRNATELELRSWASAEAWQRQYGFSEFELATGASTWQIGRLATNYFRVSGLLPPPVVSALRRIDPQRALLITSTTQLDSPHLTELTVSFRMERRI